MRRFHRAAILVRNETGEELRMAAERWKFLGGFSAEVTPPLHVLAGSLGHRRFSLPPP